MNTLTKTVSPWLVVSVFVVVGGAMGVEYVASLVEGMADGVSHQLLQVQF